MRFESAVRTAVIAFVALFSVSAVLRPEDPIAVAQREAKAGSDTPEGKKFETAVGAAFLRDHSPTILRCAKDTRQPDLTKFDLFIRVNAAGLVDEALVKPGTNLAECVRGKLKGWNAGMPPRAGFWVKVGINLKKK